MTLTVTDLQKKHFGFVTASERGAPTTDLCVCVCVLLTNLLEPSLKCFSTYLLPGIPCC
jgi:hypothetical protein